MSVLFDENVTRGHLKNLVTDKPAPITTKLAQKSDADNLSVLFDENVTRGHLKNLVTDKPAPITTKLAQISGVPVYVNPESMVASNTMANARLGISDMIIGPDEHINLFKKEKTFVQLDEQNPVYNPPFNNWSVNQPSPPHDQGDRGDQNVDLRNLIIEGVNGYDFVQQKAEHMHPEDLLNVQTENPVYNPPFNNWSVNQPSPPHDFGDNGHQDMGLRNVIIEGVNGYDLVQQKEENPVYNPPFNNWSVNQPSPPHDHGLDGFADLGQNIIVDGHHVHYAQKPKVNHLAQIIPISDEANQPGNFLVEERDANHDPIILAEKK